MKVLSLNDRSHRRRLILTLLFGWAGFAVSYYPLRLYLPHLNLTVTLGMVFPMLIAMAWGWRYALLAATVGMSAQYGWFIWLEPCGYGPFLTIPLTTLWLVWHGWCSEKQARIESPLWNHYLLELPFRVIYALLLVSLLPKLFALNPPSWAPQAISTITPVTIKSFIIVDTVNAYLTIFIADLLLNISQIRKLLKVHWRPGQISTDYVISISFFAGMLYWVTDSWLDYLLDPHLVSRRFLNHLLLDVGHHDLLHRLVFFLGCLAAGSALTWFIRERRRQEEALRQSERFLNSIIDQSPFSLWLSDANGTAMRQNQANRDLFGIRHDREVIGVYNIFKDNLLEDAGLLPSIRSVFEEGATVRFTVDYDASKVQHVNLKDALPRTLDMTISPIKDRSGKVTHALVQHNDITERERAREALAFSEARYRGLVSHMSNGVVVYSVVGEGEDFIVKEFNKGAEEIMKIRKEDAVNRSLLNVFPGAREAGFWDQYQRVWQSGTPESLGPTLYTDGRTTGWRENYVYKLPSGELVTVFNDITDRVNTENEREKLIRELERKNNELERFTYTISHDLKSPLITIRGFLNMLQYDLDDGDEKMIQEDVRRINQAAEKMGRLLDELLELSRVGRMTNPSTKFNLQDVAKEAIELVSGRIAARRAAVVTAADFPEVFADRIRILEVLQNLIDNAVKFMGEQEQPRVEIGWEKRGEDNVFYVKDNGIGLEEIHFEKIFGLFNRLNSSEEGTGVGLALVKRIIELHCGRVWVESEGLGQGSTFCFTLPGVPPQETNQEGI